MKPTSLIIAAASAAYLVVRRKRFSLEGSIFLLVVIAGLVVHGTGAVQLPNFEKLIVELGTSLGSWTYLLVGAMAFAETGAFLGFIAPGEVTVIVGGVVAGQGKIAVVPLIALVWVAAVAGDVVSYALGRRLGRGFLEKHGKRVKITPERLDRVEDFFARRGGLTILVGRFIGFVRPIAPFLAGSTRMPFRTFVPYDVLAAGVWSATFVLLGYVFWQSFDQVAKIAREGALALGAVVVLGVGIVTAVRHRERLRDQVLSTRAGRAVAGPVGFAWNRLTPGDLGLELTTLLSVAAIGLFAFISYLTAVDGTSALPPGDIQALRLVDDLRTSWAVDLARVLTWLGAAPVAWTAVIGAAAWLWRRERTLEARVLIAGLFLTWLLVQVTKVAVDRPRPIDPLTTTHNPSFPSGHSAYATAVVAAAIAVGRALAAPRRVSLVGLSLVIAVVVWVTRMYLRAHYLSDVLAGIGLAAVIFALCAAVAVVVDFVRHNEPA